MRRRDFFKSVGGAAIGWPIVAHAQQAGRLPTIGFFGASTLSASAPWVAALVQRLRELGWVDGRTVAIEYRWAEGRTERLAGIAAEFVRLKVDVIVTHSAGPVIAAKQATSVIPIVFAAVGDPIGIGLVASLARPGGNLTGISVQQTDLAGKHVELLREVVLGLHRLAILANIGNPSSVVEMGAVKAAASKFGIEAVTIEIRRSEDIVPAFETLKARADALHVCTEPLVFTSRTDISVLATAARLPTMFGAREYVEAGGLISYGANVPDLFRRAGEIVDKILRGAKPADIPVEQLEWGVSRRLSAGQKLAYVYFEDEPGRRSAARTNFTHRFSSETFGRQTDLHVTF
jgi:putative tryptophan/tyrosine transport system substrate-binding protein